MDLFTVHFALSISARDADSERVGAPIKVNGSIISPINEKVPIHIRFIGLAMDNLFLK